jgi:hypothetical protein
MSFIENNPDKPWNWYWISLNPNITMSDIEKYPDKPWKWYWISSNKFEKYFDEFRKCKCYNNFPFIKKKRKSIVKLLEHIVPTDIAYEISMYI